MMSVLQTYNVAALGSHSTVKLVLLVLQRNNEAALGSHSIVLPYFLSYLLSLWITGILRVEEARAKKKGNSTLPSSFCFPCLP